MMSIKNIAAAFAFAACVGLAGCASQKEPAEQAMAAIEKTLEASAAEIREFVPERAAEIEAKVAELRASIEEKSYGDVVTGAAEASDALKRAIADSRVARAKNRAAMETEWNELIESMPKLIAAIDKKIAVQGSKPPAGMDKAGWKLLVESYDAARDSWSASAAGMRKETFDASVKAGRDAKTTISGIRDQLGLKDS